jgi:hypothetical protein
MQGEEKLFREGLYIVRRARAHLKKTKVQCAEQGAQGHLRGAQ